MTSLNTSVGSKSTDLLLPRASVVTPRDAAFSYGGASRRVGGTADGCSRGTVRSSWISRLRPPPPPSRHSAPSPPLPADETDPTAPEACSAEGRTTVSTRESRTRPRSPSDDLDGSPSLVRDHLGLLHSNPTPSSRSFSSRFPRLEDPGAAASSFYHQPLPQREQREEKQQQQEPQAGLDRGRGAVAEQAEAAAKREGMKGGRDSGVVGFGPFQVSSKRAQLSLGKGYKKQQEQPQWKLESYDGGGCGTAPARIAEKGSYKPYVGDGCFPIFQKIIRFAAMCEEGEVAEKDRKEELQADMREGEHLDEAGGEEHY